MSNLEKLKNELGLGNEVTLLKQSSENLKVALLEQADLFDAIITYKNQLRVLEYLLSKLLLIALVLLGKGRWCFRCDSEGTSGYLCDEKI